MNDFLDNTNDFLKNSTAGKLLFYVAIIVVAVYFSFFSANNSNNLSDTSKEIVLPSTYSYTITVSMDDKIVTYTGTKDKLEDEFVKTVGEDSIQYRILDSDTIYRREDEDYILTNLDEIYDVLPYTYLNIDSINNYLNLSHKEEEEYRTYIKDIVLNSQNEEYVSIKTEDNKFIVDYSSLLKELNYDVQKCFVTFEYKEGKDNYEE